MNELTDSLLPRKANRVAKFMDQETHVPLVKTMLGELVKLKAPVGWFGSYQTR
jgi:hypothetical protein